MNKEALTAAQAKTVEYIRAHGPQMLGCTSGGKGYNGKSAEALIRKGVLVKIQGRERTITHKYDDETETFRFDYAALPGQEVV